MERLYRKVRQTVTLTSESFDDARIVTIDSVNTLLDWVGTHENIQVKQRYVVTELFENQTIIRLS